MGVYKSAILALISLTSCLEIDKNIFTNNKLLYGKCCGRRSIYLKVTQLNRNEINCFKNKSDLVVSNSLRAHTGSFPCLDVYHEDGYGKLITLHNESYYDYVNQNDYMSYPKCCPLGKSYSAAQRKCVQHPENPLGIGNTQGLVLKHGLSNCTGDENLIRNVYNFTLNADGSAKSNGKVFPPGKYCFEYDVDAKEIMLRTCNNKKDFCNDKKKCFPKCCRDGAIMIDNICVYTFEETINVDEVINGSLDDGYSIYQHFERDAEGYSRDVSTGGKIYMAENYTLTKSGVFRSLEDSDYYVSNYCVEFVENHGTKVFYYLEEADKIDRIRYILHTKLFITSIICLLLTIACYLVLPKLKNLHGKLILTYCFILAVLLSFFYHKHTVRIEQSSCAIVGFITAFIIFSSYGWLNVICFDMWMSCGHTKAISTDRRAWKRYFYCHLYGTVLPAVIVLFSVSVYAFEYLPSGWVPHLKEKCFFTRSSKEEGKTIVHYDYYLYYIVPSIIFIAINLILFAKTASYCLKVKNGINKMIDTSNIKEKKKKILAADKENMWMVLKLFIIAGIPWVAEVFSSAVDLRPNKPLHIISLIFDAFTASQGIFIFWVLILKKSILKAMKKRYCFKIEEEKSTSTNLSMPDSTGSRTTPAHNMINLEPSKIDKSGNSIVAV